MRIVNMNKMVLFSSLDKALTALFVQRDRWFLWLPVPFSLGISAYFGRLAEPSPWMAPIVLLMLLPILWIKRGSLMGVALLVMVLIAGGFAVAQLRTQMLDTVMLSHETGPVTIEGRVVEVDALPKGLRLTLDDSKLVGGWTYRDEPLPTIVRVRLKAKDTAVPQAGDVIRLRAVLLPLSAPVMPGAFDFQRHAYFTGLGGTGYAIGEVETLRSVESGGDFFENLRHAIRKRLEAGIEDKQTAAVVTAFLIGETKGISDENWEMIRQSGIAHLLAISGFHITVVTGALFFLVRALLALWPYAALHWPIKKISAGVAMGGAIFYLLLIGSPITAERAVIMACVVMIAIMLDRDPFSLRLAAFAALVLLVAQPEALIGPSFQMSFAAVVALIAFYEGAARHWLLPDRDRNVIGQAWVYLVACLLTTVVATVATAPYTLYHFGQVPVLGGLVANMMAVPLSSLVTLPFGIIACLLMPLGLEAIPLWITQESMRWIIEVARVVADWHYAVLRVNSFSAAWLVIFTLGALWICIWRGWWRWLGLIPIVVAIVGVAFTPRPFLIAADNGRLLALRDENGGLWLSHTRREKFIAEAWLEREAASTAHQPAGDWRTAEAVGVVNCDSRACLFTAPNGKRVSIVYSPETVVTDCDSVDLFIAPEARLNGDLCPSKRRQMIDMYDLRYGGAHALYVKPDGAFEIRQVARERGIRPWVPKPPPRDKERRKT